jgi:outer membrane protein OmpA-like peptidoglycan-associated protein
MIANNLESVHFHAKLLHVFVLLLFSFPVSVRSQSSTDTLIIYFNSGRFILDLKEQQNLSATLSDNINILQINSISGFTDSVGTIQDNLLLAQKRNETVIDFLKQHNLLTNNCKIFTYGEENPASRDRLALNRRVEIYYSSKKVSIVSSDTSNFKIIRQLVLENLYFRANEPILEPSSLPYLDQVSEILKMDTSDIFEIKGHVNWNPRLPPVGDPGYKIKMDQLSADRARTIFDILVEKGIPPARMFWKGMGNTEMVYPNASTDEEKRKNMRVEILILKPSIDP